jgi:diguanylate cyclase (GGDEF)-like protein/PAS domain S-box-containing protein
MMRWSSLIPPKPLRGRLRLALHGFGANPHSLLVHHEGGRYSALKGVVPTGGFRVSPVSSEPDFEPPAFATSERGRTIDPSVAGSDAARSILDNAHEAFISMDGGGFIIDWNRQAEGTFGWTREEAVGRVLSDTIIPPHHREAHLRGLELFLDTGDGPVLDQRFEIDALHRDGHEVPIELTISAVKVGEAHVFHAFLHDISERRRSVQFLASQHAITTVLAEAETVEQALPRLLCALGEEMGWEFGAYWTVADGPVLQCRETWTVSGLDLSGFEETTRLLTFKPGEGLPGRVFTSSRPEFIPDVAEAPNFLRKQEAAEAGLTAAVGLPLLEGGAVHGVMTYYTRETRHPAPELVEMMQALAAQSGRFLTILSDRSQLVERLQQLSLTDELTGIPNRRGWNEALERELARAQRNDEPLCLALLDLDRFKAFNDAHGHPAGDAVLRNAAQEWKRLLRLSDVLARCGGEEFGLVFPAWPTEHALAVIERLRAATPGGLTASAGLAAWRRGETQEQLIDRADRALYEAKSRGRDQTVTAS